MVAAVRAAYLSGKKVIVLEKAKKIGGGIVMASTMRTFGSKWQKDRNIPDVTDSFLRQVMDLTYWKLDSKLVGNCIRGTGEFFDWLCEIGDNIEDKFRIGRYVFDGEDGQLGPQMGGPGGKGSGRFIMDMMLEKCKELGVEVITEARVTDVEVSGGRITAVIAETKEGAIRVSCKASVMSIGSWINNKEVMEKICPAFNRAKMDASAHKNPNYTGDGIALAEKVGAFLDYDSFCLRLMGPMTMCGSMVMSTIGNSDYVIYVNLNGERFVCEPSQIRMGLFDSGHVLLDQPDALSYVIFDENTLMAAIEKSRKPQEGDGGFFGHDHYPDTMDEVYADIERGISGRGGMGGPPPSDDDKEGSPPSGDGAKDGPPPSDDAMGAPGGSGSGKAFKADTIEELAAKLNINAENLKNTVDRYNSYCEKGFDWDYFKPAESLVPIAKPPYYAVKASLGTDGAFGGVLVNPDMQAYKEGGGLVEGLYVTGDFASGRFINQGGVKKQALNDMSYALSSGFLAGNSAAKYLTELK